jgi:hypothetical protein
VDRTKKLRTLGIAVLVGSLFTVSAMPAVGQQGNSDKIIIGETAAVAGSELSTGNHPALVVLCNFSNHQTQQPRPRS